jgi:peptide/nickel transport system ATP-binding protein
MSGADTGSHLLEVDDLVIDFHTTGGTVQAVDGISYHVDRGETLAVLGESGAGKSVQASAIMGILDMPPGRILRGSIRFDGQDLLTMPLDARRDLNGRRIAMIFQDTLAHLNPVYAIGWQIAEALRVHGGSAGDARREALHLLERVGIPSPEKRLNDYPHQFSGGQRQRVMIAMALALKPELLIADEPTTALDVTVQAQILKLLRELKDETGMGLLLITHDLGVVAETADRVVVMNRGKIVESGVTRQVFKAPAHAYTRRLIGAIPGLGALHERDGRNAAPLIEVQELVKHYALTKGLMRRATGEVVKAVDGVSLTL